jgi:hypothetical protein
MIMITGCYSLTGTTTSSPSACIGMLSNAAVPVTAASVNNRNNADFIGYAPHQKAHSSEIVGFRLFGGFWVPRSADCVGCCAPATTP